MDELQAGIEPSLAVFRPPPVLLQPGKAALHHPTLWHDLEGVQLATFGNLYCDVFTQCVTHALRKGLAHIAAVAQQCLCSSRDSLQIEKYECIVRHLGDCFGQQCATGSSS